MNFTIKIEPVAGGYTAHAVGAPEYRADGATERAALEAVERQLTDAVREGKLVTIVVEPKEPTELFGSFTHDSTTKPDVELKTGADLITYWNRFGLFGSMTNVDDSQVEARRLRDQAQSSRSNGP